MIPLIQEINNDIPPVERFRAMKDLPYPFFLDSALAGGRLGRWSFMGADPFLVFRSKKDAVSLIWEDGRRETFTANPFSALREILSRYRTARTAGEVPFVSGGVGYFSYDLKDFVERLPDRAADDLGLPDCIIGFYRSVIAIDHLRQKAYRTFHDVVLEEAPEVRWRHAPSRVASSRSGVSAAPLVPGCRGHARGAQQGPVSSNFTRASYEKAVLLAKEYIRRGDIYQVNLSQRFEADFSQDPFELYVRLRRANPAPFASYLDLGDAVIMSSSPERFLKKEGTRIETRPIKGTRPRGKSGDEDMRFRRELITSRKDAAEHVMIVDLERNDLGRVCEYGTVAPSEFMALEEYSTVFHLVSTVRGSLKSSVTPVDCLVAAFPGGSITGAPKIRSMEIIEELEPVKRSVYTGAIGYIDFNGDMDTSIVIRTFMAAKGRIYFQAGGGIVADSDPGAEYLETLDKARALIDSLENSRLAYSV